MQGRELGPDGLAVPEIGVGCWQLGGGWSNHWNDGDAAGVAPLPRELHDRLAGVYRAHVRDFIRGPY